MIKAALQAAASFFRWLAGRQEIANDPELRKNKAAREDQDRNDRIASLVRTATTDPDRKKAAAAAAELRRLNAE